VCGVCVCVSCVCVCVWCVCGVCVCGVCLCVCMWCVCVCGVCPDVCLCVCVCVLRHIYQNRRRTLWARDTQSATLRLLFGTVKILFGAHNSVHKNTGSRLNLVHDTIQHTHTHTHTTHTHIYIYIYT